MITRRSFFDFIGNHNRILADVEPTLAGRSGKKQTVEIWLYLSIIGKELNGDWKSVMKQTVDYGITEIEIGNNLLDSAAGFLIWCKEIGIQPVAGGISFTEKEDELKKKLDGLCDLNLKYAVNCWPWLTGGPFRLEDCKKALNY